MECELCGIKPEEKWENYGPFNEEDFKPFHGKIYCSSCRFQIADVLIKEMFKLEKYKEIIKIVEEIKNLDNFQGFDNDSIIFILISFLKLSDTGDTAKEFWMDNKEDVLGVIPDTQFKFLTIEMEEFIEESKFNKKEFLDNFYEVYQWPAYAQLTETPQFKIIKLFISSLINKKETKEEVILTEALEFFKNKRLIDSFETRMREVIIEHLKKNYGDRFFEDGKGIPDDLKNQLLEMMKYTKSKEPWKKKITPFDESAINNLKSIILYNWDNIFKDIFISKSTLKNHFENINYWRNCLYHPKGEISESTKMIGCGSIEWFKKMIGF